MKPKTFSHPELIKKFPEEVKILFKIFGDDIRLVGGCVRDLLLKKNLNDFDFATKTLPSETVRILEKNKLKAVPTGVKFGTITAVVNGKNFEITTLRKDNETDGRHCNPEFVDDFYFDAARRDFTINALYLDSKGLVADYFDGISDLKNQKVKFIGDADKRIEEDFLRILRFFRFSCEYAVKLDNKGLTACVALKEKLKKLSRERIRAEFLKMIATSKEKNLLAILKVLESKKISDEILSGGLDIKALKAIFEVEKNFKISLNSNIKIAVLLLTKTTVLENLFTEICATNSEKKYFEFCAKNQTLELGKIKELLTSEPQDKVLELYLFSLVKKFSALKKSETKMAEVKKNILFLQKFSLPEFPLNSSDIADLGMSGKDFGLTLKKAKKFWAENNFQLSKKELISFLNK